MTGLNPLKWSSTLQKKIAIGILVFNALICLGLTGTFNLTYMFFDTVKLSFVLVALNLYAAYLLYINKI